MRTRHGTDTDAVVGASSGDGLRLAGAGCSGKVGRMAARVARNGAVRRRFRVCRRSATEDRWSVAGVLWIGARTEEVGAWWSRACKRAFRAGCRSSVRNLIHPAGRGWRSRGLVLDITRIGGPGHCGFNGLAWSSLGSSPRTRAILCGCCQKTL